MKHQKGKIMLASYIFTIIVEL
uniref:Uncharacterized protein n=1 Tax=Anguilla anguilla TaxID=7936 RepID=A0A0E9QQU9_ANGAN